MNEWTTTAHQAHWLHASARHHSVRKPFITTQILWGRGVANYADFCFKVFQDRVNNWSTAYLQRAEVRCCSGYDNGIHAPGGDSRTELDIVLILSHAVGVHRYPKKYQGRIGILLDFVWHKPFSSGTTDQAATHRAKDFPLDGSFSPLSMVAT